jgi:hypothetical protein
LGKLARAKPRLLYIAGNPLESKQRDRSVQEEFSQPIALILETSEEATNALNQVGYRFFTDIKSLYRYLEVHRNITLVDHLAC